MLALVLPRLVDIAGTARRSLSVTERNVVSLRPTTWLVIVTGLFEPLFFLLSIGLGVGALVGDLPLADGTLVPYATFVAPAMLAASAMNGVLAETVFGFFGKMKFAKLYDGMLATPVRPIEIAFGELAWAMARGSAYSAAFLLVMVMLDLVAPWRAVAALPAAILVGFAFGGLGMATATLIRSWQDFDLVATVQFALFLFSGTFLPATAYPAAVRWLVEVTPLYRSVDLIRAITTGTVGWWQLLDVGYLLVVTAAGVMVAGRRMGRLLAA